MKTLKKIKTFPNLLTDLAFSQFLPDSKSILIAKTRRSGEVYEIAYSIWDIQAGMSTQSFIHQDVLSNLLISPNSKYLLLAESTGLRLVDLMTGSEIHQYC